MKLLSRGQHFVLQSCDVSIVSLAVLFPIQVARGSLHLWSATSSECTCRRSSSWLASAWVGTLFVSSWARISRIKSECCAVSVSVRDTALSGGLLSSHLLIKILCIIKAPLIRQTLDAHTFLNVNEAQDNAIN